LGLNDPGDLLYESIAATASVVVFLELNEFKLTKRLENVLKILLGDAEVDVSNIQPVERDRVGVGAGAVCSSDLSILLSLCKLDDDRNT
jgi:hypothetical protein